MHLETEFHHRLEFLRLTHDPPLVLRFGPAHDSVAEVTLCVRSLDSNIIAVATGQASKTKDATRDAMKMLLDKLVSIPDPCVKNIAWLDLANKELTGVEVITFRNPQAHWFGTPQHVGVDWEGSPPCLVQIACAHGIGIDVISAPWVQFVLGDARHTHGVFGAHEMGLVANPVNLQTNPVISLPEMYSRTFIPEYRIIKDRTFHTRIDWSSCAHLNILQEEGRVYAAFDAYATRKLLLAGVGP